MCTLVYKLSCVVGTQHQQADYAERLRDSFAKSIAAKSKSGRKIASKQPMMLNTKMILAGRWQLPALLVVLGRAWQFTFERYALQLADTMLY